MKLYFASWKQKWITVWKVLTNDYHICFCFSKPVKRGSRIEVGAWFSKYHRENELIDDVVNCLDKQDYLEKENR